MDGGAWWATVHRVTESRTRLSDFTHSLTHSLMMYYRASLVAQRLKRLPGMQETWVGSLGREDPWRRKWQPTPVLQEYDKYRGGKC